MVKEQKVKESTFLYVDTIAYQNALSNEAILMGLYQSLQKKSREILGEDFDLDNKLYLSDPKAYLIEEYFKLSGRPPRLKLNAERVLVADFGIDIDALHSTGIQFKRVYDGLGIYAPKIQKKALKSTIYEAQFHKYLAKDKQEFYTVLCEFYKSAMKLKAFGTVGKTVGLVRYAPPGSMLLDGFEAKINLESFI